jgi:hypothetical protein
MDVAIKPASEPSNGKPGNCERNFELTHTISEHPSLYNILPGFREIAQTPQIVLG